MKIILFLLYITLLIFDAVMLLEYREDKAIVFTLLLLVFVNSMWLFLSTNHADTTHFKTLKITYGGMLAFGLVLLIGMAIAAICPEQKEFCKTWLPILLSISWVFYSQKYNELKMA